MIKNLKAWITILMMVAIVLLTGGRAALLALSGGPPAARTGDFGEVTCTACHAGNSLNAAGGTLTITGVPTRYQPGATYSITVGIQKGGQTRWGFQLAARATQTSQQAGILLSKNASTQIVSANGIQYIEHTSAGTSPGTTSGNWTFDWTAPATAIGSIRFSAAGNAANNNGANSGDFIYNTTVTSEAPLVTQPITALFAHLAFGQGFTTLFTLLNTGSTPVVGSLILTGQDGTPLNASLTGATESALAPAHEAVSANSTAISIPPGGVRFVTASAVNPDDPLKSGWARLESTGGTPTGVSTFQLTSDGRLASIAGVLASDTVENATVPIDDDVPAERMTGYAVANPGSEAITIKAVTLKEDGTAGAALQSIILGPGQQKAQFVFQDPAASSVFKGSLVLMGQNGQKFAVVALVQNQGLYTAIPVVPTKPFGVN